MIRFVPPLSLACLLALGQPLAAQTQTVAVAETHAEPIVEFLDMQGCNISDAARMLTTMTRRTVVATEVARNKPVDALIENLPLESALKVLCRASGLVYRFDAEAGLFTILTLEEYQRTAIEATSGVQETRTFKVGTANLNQIASAVTQLYGSRVVMSGTTPIEDFREPPGTYNQQMSGYFSNRSQRINNGNISRRGSTSAGRNTSTSDENPSDVNNGYGYGYGSGGYGGYGGYMGGYPGYGGYMGGGYGGYGGMMGGYGGYLGGYGGYGGFMGGNRMYGNGFGGYNGMFPGMGGFNGMGMGGMGMGYGYGGFPYPLSNDTVYRRSSGNQGAEIPGAPVNSEAVLSAESSRSTQVTTRTEALEQVAKNSGQPLIYLSVSYEHCYLLVRTADAQALKDIEKLIVQLDEVVPQVILEMKILQLDVGDGFTSSVSINLNSKNDQYAAAQRDPITGNPIIRDPVTGEYIERDFLGFENAINLGNFASDAAATFAYQYLSDHINARVELLSRDNRVEVLATPLLIATNNRSAQIEIGEERIITVGASSSIIDVPGAVEGTTLQREFITPQTEKRTIGLVLDILPRINEDGTVTLSVVQESTNLKPRNNSIQVGTTIIPIDSVDTANVDATVVAKNNCTIAVGGLIRTENSLAQSKVPLLGDIPVLGLPFRRKEKAAKKTELILLITPHILYGKGDDSDVTRQLMSRVSDHRYHVGGEKMVERDIPELEAYKSRATRSYREMNNTNQVPSNTDYWRELGGRPPAPTDPAPVVVPVEEPKRPGFFKRMFRKGDK